MKHQLFLCFCILALCSFSTFGQVELKLLSPKNMKKDLKELVETIEGHPDPYTKISKEDLQVIIDEVEENISVEIDALDCYKNFSKIISAIGDGHTSLYMNDFWLRGTRKEYGAFPYDVFLTNDNELFVIKTYGDSKIQLGAQILEINGMRINDFVGAIDPYISYELETFRNDKISESFEFYLYLVFKQVDQLRFKIRDVDSEVVIPTMDFKEWKSLKKDLREQREEMIAKGKPYDFEIVKPGIAMINIFSFSVPDIERYNFFLNETFKKIKKNEVHSLIIDVRGNYGGYPKVSSELFHYIHDGYFKTMAKSSMKISYPYRKAFTDRYPMLLNANVNYAEHSRFNIDLKSVIRGEVNTYKDEDVIYNETPIEENFEFKGDCYLLIDRKSYSASSSFASTFQCYSMGTIIGEPTGGTKIFRANAFLKVLPKSRFSLMMASTKKYSTCYNNENEPVLPNIEAAPSILDLVHDSDSSLNYTLMLINKVQKQKAKEK